MRLDRTKSFLSHRGSVVRFFAVAGFFCACLSSVSYAQRSVSDERSRVLEGIDPVEGTRRIESFRNQRLQGDYCFRFELEHLPRFDDAYAYQGTMWGAWNDKGPVTRIELFLKRVGDGDVREGGKVELIIQNGPESAVWRRDQGMDEFIRLEAEQLFEPVIPGIVYTAFDLQMPFIYWNQYSYEGPSVVQRTRVAQQFLMHSPDGSAARQQGIHSVRIGLDNEYDALLLVELMDEASVELSRFTVEKWKKIQGQYIVKEVSLRDNRTRDRTRFKVKAATVGLILEDEMFEPSEGSEPVRISNALFDVL